MSSNKNGGTTDRILTEVKNLAGMVTGLSTEVKGLSAEVTSLTRQVDRIDERLSDVEQHVGNMSKDLAEIHKNTDLIPEIMIAISEASSDIDDHEKRIAGLEQPA
jgi:predicted RNase H-like nuclease (RuvC/YqgF family)